MSEYDKLCESVWEGPYMYSQIIKSRDVSSILQGG